MAAKQKGRGKLSREIKARGIAKLFRDTPLSRERKVRETVRETTLEFLSLLYFLPSIPFYSSAPRFCFKRRRRVSEVASINM